MSPPAPILISIVTPSYKQADWLRLCAASVADQKAPGLEVEHIVQDSLSGPAVAEAVRRFPAVQLVSEKDDGMFDAINRGWALARGDILCWLNCDEQYLPGTLATVADYFRAHPETDILFADIVVVDGSGDYVCSRQVLKPQLYHTWTSHLNTFSCATFLRRRLIHDRKFAFDASWKMAGDAEMLIRMLQAGVTMDVLRQYASTFVDNGENLGLRPRAREEQAAMLAQAPFFARSLRSVWKLAHRLRRFLHGHYRPKPFSYEIYTLTSPDRRLHVEVPRPTFYWEARM